MKLENLNQLRALYDLPKERPLKKQMAALDAHCINLIQKSPFLTLATVSAAGKMDVSPRGGTAGFVKVLNPNQLLIPDSKGNNRLDSLNNIIETGQVGILFFLPGMDETLRLNG